MKKFIIMMMLATLLFTGCVANDISTETSKDDVETIEHETILFENVEIETFETNTDYWD